MSLPKRINVSCSKCGESISVTAFQSLNTDYSKDIPEKIISGELFDAKCPRCGFVSHLEYDFLYHDLRHNAMIWVANPDSPDYTDKVADIRSTNLVPYKVLRIVEDTNALREKVACLERGRDDRVIELCKVCFASDILLKRPDFDFRNAFYTTATDGKEFLYFYDQNGNELGCELPEKAYDTMKELYDSSQFALQFDPNYAIVDSKWAEKIFPELVETNLIPPTASVQPEQNNLIGHESVKAELTCVKCGNTLPADSEFCQYCGTKLEAIPKAQEPEHLNQKTPTDVTPRNKDKQNSTSLPKTDTQKSKTKYCSRCGSLIDSDTKICTGCGKKYFKGIRINKTTAIIAVLSTLLVAVSSLCVLQYVNALKIKTDNQNFVDRLQDEITELRDETTALENEVDSLGQLVRTKQSTISKQENRIDELEESLYFFDEYAEIVPDDGTNTYHKYWCSQLGDFESFWIYNTENAEYNGYSACPDCH